MTGRRWRRPSAPATACETPGNTIRAPHGAWMAFFRFFVRLADAPPPRAYRNLCLQPLLRHRPFRFDCMPRCARRMLRRKGQWRGLSRRRGIDARPCHSRAIGASGAWSGQATLEHLRRSWAIRASANWTKSRSSYSPRTAGSHRPIWQRRRVPRGMHGGITQPARVCLERACRATAD